MPEKWVDPEVFLQYRGVKIFHVYRHDVLSERRTFSYGNSIDCSDDGGDTFDVRDLPVPDDVIPKDHVAIIKAAIDAGDPKVIGEQVVLDEDEPEKGSFAVFGYYGDGDSFVDVVLAETAEDVQGEVIRKRSDMTVTIVVIMVKSELMVLAESMK